MIPSAGTAENTLALCEQVGADLLLASSKPALFQECMDISPGTVPVTWTAPDGRVAEVVGGASYGADARRKLYADQNSFLTRSLTPLESNDTHAQSLSKLARLTVAKRSFHRSIDPWLRESLSAIEYLRNAGSEAAYERVETALYAIQHFSAVPISIRPILALGDDDVPSFATSIADTYLHLTIDHPGKMTWYATIGDEEFFAEDVDFDGEILPNEVEYLLAKMAARI